ncbi:riboflavin synthase [Risungbinella massiliensis]|uniref:riboflavin synthase n=1 Tax=Risungbinella massiliensis TaxID=1329796 RepID=UPI0005CBB202|nr:riboflavin synthase [Risungbinella massiliensis]
MFTGIIEERGTVKSIQREEEHLRLKIACKEVIEHAKVGDSISVNGVCLTVTSLVENTFTADVIPETFRRTQLGQLSVGSQVNLEGSLKFGGRVHGHLVQGHVDTVGKVVSKTPEGNAITFVILYEPKWGRYLIDKGSIAVNGISLTVFDVGSDRFSVSIIPHTLEMTNLETTNEGDVVNLEFDLTAKYLEKWSRLAEVTPIESEQD